MFGLNVEVYSINFRVSPEHGKISAKNYSVFCYFSYSGSVKIIPLFHEWSYYAVCFFSIRKLFIGQEILRQFPRNITDYLSQFSNWIVKFGHFSNQASNFMYFLEKKYNQILIVTRKSFSIKNEYMKS